MRFRLLYLFIVVLVHQNLLAQTANKITGPLGLYHTTSGYTYNDSLGIDSIPTEYEFGFGELNFPDQSFDNGFYFEPDLDSCVQWNANRVFGIIQPLHEGGVYNQPADTALFAPFPQLNGPGMIQGGQRFSRLSQLYSGVCGVILDDWNGDTTITGEVRDAVQGKYVDAEGNVHHECPPTTPYNKLYVVLYQTGVDYYALPYFDGASYWIFDQSCCYAKLDSAIDSLRFYLPHKEILAGIYIKNSTYGWQSPVSVQYMLAHALNRYDDGDINGITLFAGIFLLKDQMSLSQWNSYNLPAYLDSVYYPYLGEGMGKVYNCQTNNALSGVAIHAFCRGRVSGDTMMRSYQLSNVGGQYQFGLWAGNRNTDSTYYWLIAEKAGYTSDTVGFWIKRNDTTYLPNLSLCPEPDTINSVENYMLVFPNPTHGLFTVEDNLPAAMGGALEVYDLLGNLAYSTTYACGSFNVDLSAQANGAYLVLIRTSDRKVTQKRLLLLQH